MACVAIQCRRQQEMPEGLKVFGAKPMAARLIFDSLRGFQKSPLFFSTL
jgi:hypothetical protein